MVVSCSTSVKAWFSAAMASVGESVVAGTRALKPLVADHLAGAGVDQLGEDLDLGVGLAARHVDLEGAEIGDQSVLADRWR